MNRLHKTGCLLAGWSGGWQWTENGKQVAWIGLRSETDRLHLSYRVRIAGGEWEPVEETVGIVRVPCRLGGNRPYFFCPGVVNGVECGRRVVKLYGAARYFLCRHCYALDYASQRESSLDRTLRRANKIRRRLGGEAGMASRFPQRPKGMWRRTYKRLQWQIFDAEMAADEAIENRLARVNARLKVMRRSER